MSISALEIGVWQVVSNFTEPNRLRSHDDVLPSADKMVKDITRRLNSARRYSHFGRRIFDISEEQTAVGHVVTQTHTFLDSRGNPYYHATVTTTDDAARAIAINPIPEHDYAAHEQQVPITWLLQMQRDGRKWNFESFTAQLPTLIGTQGSDTARIGMKLTRTSAEQLILIPLNPNTNSLITIATTNGVDGTPHHQLGIQVQGNDTISYADVSAAQPFVRGALAHDERPYIVETELRAGCVVFQTYPLENHLAVSRHIFSASHALDTLQVAEQATQRLSSDIKTLLPYW